MVNSFLDHRVIIHTVAKMAKTYTILWIQGHRISIARAIEYVPEEWAIRRTRDRLVEDIGDDVLAVRNELRALSKISEHQSGIRDAREGQLNRQHVELAETAPEKATSGCTSRKNATQTPYLAKSASQPVTASSTPAKMS